MKEIATEQLKSIEISILDYIDKVCRENGIVYSLAYGTLLGAVRHQGFIPWDDDIDICMDRENFEKFERKCNDDGNKQYQLLWLDTCETYTLPLAKVVDTTTILTQNTQNEKMPLGVYVDLFIYDKIPDDEKMRAAYINKLELYQRFWGYSQNKYVWKDHSLKSYLRFLVYCLFHLVNPRRFSLKLNKIAQTYRTTDKPYFLGPMVFSTRRYKEWFPSSLFDDCSDTDFEDKKYPITSQYDIYLRKCFGNYMELPPIEKRVSNHDFEAYYKSAE